MSEEPLYNFHDRPDYAVLLGQMAATWAGIEFRMSHIFTWMMGCSPLHGPAAFFMLQNNTARMSMIRGLMQYLHTDDERRSIKIVLEKVSEASSIRNRYMHTPWLRNGDTLYLMENIGIRYPHGFKKKVKYEDLYKDCIKVVECSRWLEGEISRLTKARPLQMRRETVPTPLQQKFDELFRFQMVSSDPANSKSEEPPPRGE